MAFPSNPTIGDLFTNGSKTFRWNGSVWTRYAETTTSYSNAKVRAYLGNVDGPLVPASDEGFSLGTASRKWSNLYLSGNTIVLGNTKIQASEDGSIDIASTNPSSTSKISFKHTGQVILGDTKLESGEEGQISIKSRNPLTTSAFSLASNGYIASQAGTYTTANIAEQGNLYFTNARVYSNILSLLNTNSITEGANLYFTNARTIAALTSGAGISIAANGRITSSGAVTAVGGSTGSISNIMLACAIINSSMLNTSNVSEGSNLYFTNTRSIYSLTAGTNMIINSNGMITANVTSGGASTKTLFAYNLLFGG
jgi:hypothetical protein